MPKRRGDGHLWLEGAATGTTLEGWSAAFTLRRAEAPAEPQWRL